MTGWTPDELTVLADAGSLRLTTGHEPGPEVELGMVLVSDELYVRAYRGPQSRWLKAAGAVSGSEPWCAAFSWSPPLARLARSTPPTVTNTGAAAPS